jgi:transposase
VRLRTNLLACSEETTLGKRHTESPRVDLLELLNRKLAEFDRLIAAVLVDHPDQHLFRRFPGVATILAATLLGRLMRIALATPLPRFCSPKLALLR